jgi:glutamyl-tRNA reductase
MQDATVRPPRFDAVIAATSSSRPVITPETRAHWPAPLFIDLGSVPNVDPRLDSEQGIYVVRLGDLGGVEELSSEIDAAGAIVSEDVSRFLSRAQRGR